MYGGPKHHCWLDTVKDCSVLNCSRCDVLSRGYRVSRQIRLLDRMHLSTGQGSVTVGGRCKQGQAGQSLGDCHDLGSGSGPAHCATLVRSLFVVEPVVV